MSDSDIAGRALFERAQTLSFPRYPGTDGDRRAIARVRSWFEAAGLDVTEESFRYDIRPAFRALTGLLAVSALLVLVAGLEAREHPFVSLGVLGVVISAAGMLLGWSPWLERIYRRDGPTQTANVVGKRRRKLPGCAQGTLILVAHHDSKSQNLTLPLRAALTLGATFGTLALACLVAAGAAGASPGAVPVTVVAGVAAAALLALATLRSGNRSPGGVDNAGSVAIVAALAPGLVRDVDPAIDLVFLSPGAEEDHMVGAMRWLERHADELTGAPVFALNLDGAGIPGRIALLERYGFGTWFSRTLSAFAREEAQRLGLPVRGTLLPPAMGIDAIPFAHRGIDCLTLASGSLCAAVLAVHSARDRGGNLDPQALEHVARLARSIVLRLGAELVNPAGGPRLQTD